MSYDQEKLEQQERLARLPEPIRKLVAEGRAKLVQVNVNNPEAPKQYIIQPTRSEALALLAEQAAREVCPAPNCPQCYGRGFIGRNQLNSVLLCSKCMDSGEMREAVMGRLHELEAEAAKTE